MGIHTLIPVPAYNSTCYYYKLKIFTEDLNKEKSILDVVFECFFDTPILTNLLKQCLTTAYLCFFKLSNNKIGF